MLLTGFVACPADANKEIKAIADYVSGINGGHEAVRDCIEYVLRERGEWERAIMQVYHIDRQDVK